VNDIHDKGITTGLQYDRWIASIKAKQAARQSRTRRVMHSNVTFLVVLYVGLISLAALILWQIGALAPFLGK
jgi:cyanate permease